MEKLPHGSISDSDLLQAVLKWIVHDEPRRKKHVHDLTKRINFSTVLDTRPLLLAHNILENDSKCSNILYNVFKGKALRGTDLLSGQTSPFIQNNKRPFKDLTPINQSSEPSARLSTPTATNTEYPRASDDTTSENQTYMGKQSSTSSSQRTLCGTMAKRSRNSG